MTLATTPPPTPLLTRLFLESPWPVLAIGVGATVVLAVVGLRAGRTRPLLAAGVALAATVALFLLERAVVTPAERAEAITLALVEAAEAGDVAGARALFASGATMSLGSPRNPGFDLAWIDGRLANLRGSYRIEENRVTQFDAYSSDGRRGEAHLSCYTVFEGAGAPTLSGWIVQVEPTGEDGWKITKLTSVKINGRTPAPSWFR